MFPRDCRVLVRQPLHAPDISGEESGYCGIKEGICERVSVAELTGMEKRSSGGPRRPVGIALMPERPGQIAQRDGAERSFRAALSIASEQGTKGFELRAATSLARLLGDDGGQEEARELLAPVYGLFTEGFDTPDLRDAQALLAELAQAAARLTTACRSRSGVIPR